MHFKEELNHVLQIMGQGLNILPLLNVMNKVTA